MSHIIRTYCQRYIEYLLKKYPSLDLEECQELVFDKLISKKFQVKYDLVCEIVEVLYDEIFDQNYHIDPEE